MEVGKDNEKSQTAGIQPAAEIVISVVSGEIGCSVNKNGEPRTTLDIGNTEAVRAKEEKVKTRGEKGKEKRATIDLEKGMEDHETEEEKLCRICHLSSEMVGPMDEGWELIVIGCGCKGDLGIAHRRCAEAWFRVKGNRLCEICGLTAKSIVGKEYYGSVEVCRESRSSSGAVNRALHSRGACWTGQRFCSFLVSFLVITFVLQWYFRESGT